MAQHSITQRITSILPVMLPTVMRSTIRTTNESVNCSGIEINLGIELPCLN